MHECVCILATMDKSHNGLSLCAVCNSSIAMAHHLYRRRWFDPKRSAPADRWHICFGIITTLVLAYTAAYATFHQTHSTKANHTDSLDGAHLLVQCGN